MRLFRHELRTQQLLFWRNRESAVFVFIFPPMLFLLLGAVYDGTDRRLPGGRRAARPACSATAAPTPRSPGSRSRS